MNISRYMIPNIVSLAQASMPRFRLICDPAYSASTCECVTHGCEPQLNMVKTKFFYSSCTTQFSSNSFSEKMIPYLPNSMSQKPCPHPALLYI